MEGKLLSAAIASRSAYDKIVTLDGADGLTEVAKQIWKRIAQYYSADVDATMVDLDILRERIVRAHPSHREIFESILDNLPSVSPPNVVEYVKENKLACLSLEIHAAIEKCANEKASELMRQWLQLYDVGFTEGGSSDDLFNVLTNVSAASLSEALQAGSKFKLYPLGLNKIVSGLLPGDHILVFAAPETGKSATGITLACGFAYSGLKVLYCGNEDPAMRMVGRIKSCLSGMTAAEMAENPKKADVIAAKRGYGNIIFKSLSPGSTDDIKRLCKHFKPDVCIVDQVLNLHLSGSKDPGNTERLEKVCQMLRTLYKETGILGISISQADDKARGKLMLGIENVYYSNIGVQGQVDVMIGVGMDKNFEAKSMRWLNVVKNKASGQHLGCRVRLDWRVSKLEDA